MKYIRKLLGVIWLVVAVYLVIGGIGSYAN